MSTKWLRGSPPPPPPPLSSSETYYHKPAVFPLWDAFGWGGGEEAFFFFSHGDLGSAAVRVTNTHRRIVITIGRDVGKIPAARLSVAPSSTSVC